MFDTLFVPGDQPTAATVDCIPGFTDTTHDHKKDNKCVYFNEIAEIIEDPSYTSGNWVTTWTHCGVVLLQIK